MSDHKPTHDPAPDTHTAISPKETTESRGVGARFIAGFAATGLLLAGVVGVWTLQSTNGENEARHNTVSDQSTIGPMSSEHASPSSSSRHSQREQSSPRQRETPRSSTPRNFGRPQNDEGLEAGGNFVAPLGEDPYLPPNAWEGQQSSDTATQQPETSQTNPAPATQPQPQTSESSKPGHLNWPYKPEDIWDILNPEPSNPGPATPTETTTELPSPTKPSQPETSQPQPTPNKGTPESGDGEDHSANGERSAEPTDTTAQ